MTRTRRTVLAALTTALATTAIACGGAPAAAPSVPSAPEPPSATSPAGYAGGDGAPAEARVSPSMDDSSAKEASPPSAPPAPPGAFKGGSQPSQPQAGARPSPTSEGEAASPKKADVAPDPVDRPGLGTQWGETRSSRITTVPFVRADGSSPFATAALFYNDAQGANAMSTATGFRRTPAGTFTVASGAVAVGLRDEHGGFLSGFVAGDRNYVVGEAGRRYTIVLKNRSPIRFECVISVDGLDVLDGKAASFGKRGYLLDPNGELEIDGFRQSTEAVAAFRFGSVRGSYANQKHGDTRNVGVIGVALFHERGTNPFQWTQDEVNRRHDANPFPGQFATPPN